MLSSYALKFPHYQIESYFFHTKLSNKDRGIVIQTFLLFFHTKKIITAKKSHSNNQRENPLHSN